MLMDFLRGDYLSVVPMKTGFCNNGRYRIALLINQTAHGEAF